TGYNPRKFSKNHRMWMTSRRRLLVVCSVIAVALGTVRPCIAAAEWSMPAEELARRIVAISGPGAAGITLNNTSSLSTADMTAFQRVLIERLRAAGVN